MKKEEIEKRLKNQCKKLKSQSRYVLKTYEKY